MYENYLLPVVADHHHMHIMHRIRCSAEPTNHREPPNNANTGIVAISTNNTISGPKGGISEFTPFEGGGIYARIVGRVQV
jgi:hypothetical protein